MEELTLFNLKGYISDAIDDNNKGKINLLEILDWLITWDKGLEEEKRLFCYKRESINVGLTTIPHKNKINKPAFLVIKFFNTDRNFKDPHIDFYLGMLGYPKYNKWLIQRPHHLSRWIFFIDRGWEIELDDLKNIIKDSFTKRFPVRYQKQI